MVQEIPQCDGVQYHFLGGKKITANCWSLSSKVIRKQNFVSNGVEMELGFKWSGNGTSFGVEWKQNFVSSGVETEFHFKWSGNKILF
jgi:hypothetical protein